MDAPIEADAAVEADASDGPAGFFIAGDILDMTWVATHNILPLGNYLFEEATVDTSMESALWYVNFHLPPGPVPFTVPCGDSNYLQFREMGYAPGSRLFSSRNPAASCSLTFVVPAVPGTLEGTFTATLVLAGTTMTFPVTNGRFRLPAAP
jgi:hypothetical protein